MNRFLLFVLMLAISPMFLNAQVDETKPVRVTKAVAFATSAPLSELAAVLSPDKAESNEIIEVKNKLQYEKWPDVDMSTVNENVQTTMGTRQSRGPGVGFNGQGPTGYFPPDTDGDVSDTHFVQVVNSKYNVYLKDGTKVLGPLNLSTLWAGLPKPGGGSWGNDGDPIVLWDEADNRWVITQFEVSGSAKYELFAVSETSDPLGSYHLYAFSFGTTMNDYPKLGVWRDGYYATYNMFQNSSFTGSRITVVDKSKMIVGDATAEMVEFHKSGYYSTMPADIDGNNLPDEGEPCPVMYITNGQDIQLWDFHVDWDNTNNSSLNLGTTLDPSSFSETPNCNPDGSGGFITQPGTSQRLDGLGGMIMNRLAYRKFDTHESMVVTHSIRVNTNTGNYRGAIRWYEFRKSGSSSWTMYQEGTYAPDDTHRWMGSAAMNGNGDIAIAYSCTNSDDVYPSIRYSGRRVDDPLGEMTVTEVELKTGSTSQTSFHRWGDYACLNVDPANDTTFWFTTEYNGWRTWIASFDLGEITGPSVNAGADEAICQNQQFHTSASGAAVLDMLWTTDGDGSFSPNNAFDATYLRGSNDVANGGCTLTLTVTGFDGVTTASDDLYLSIIPKVDAGEDADIVDTESYNCQGSTNAPNGTITWTTSGDGTFSDASMLTPIYSIGTGDIAAGSVTLNMSVSITSPCDDTEDDDMVITIHPEGVNDIEKNNTITVFPNPTHDIFTLNIEDLAVGDDFTFFVYTSYGKEVYRQIVNAKSDSYKKVIDLSNFKAGIYFVSVTSSKGSSTMKVVKK